MEECSFQERYSKQLSFMGTLYAFYIVQMVINRAKRPIWRNLLEVNKKLHYHQPILLLSLDFEVFHISLDYIFKKHN